MRAGLDVHLDHDALDAEGPGDRVGIEEGAGAEPGAARLGERAAPHRGARHLAEAAGSGRARPRRARGPRRARRPRARTRSSSAADQPRLVRDLARRSAPPRGPPPRPRGSRWCPCRSRPELVSPPTDDHAARAAPPSSSAQIWARVVSWPWPWAQTPRWTNTVPSGIHADVGALEGPDAGALHVRRRARGRSAARSRAAAPARRASPRSRGARGARSKAAT